MSRLLQQGSEHQGICFHLHIQCAPPAPRPGPASLRPSLSPVPSSCGCCCCCCNSTLCSRHQGLSLNLRSLRCALPAPHPVPASLRPLLCFLLPLLLPLWWWWCTGAQSARRKTTTPHSWCFRWKGVSLRVGCIYHHGLLSHGVHYTWSASSNASVMSPRAAPGSGWSRLDTLTSSRRAVSLQTVSIKHCAY